jgi:hypothetical protein
MVNPDDFLLAHHNPIPVRFHWQDEVKAGLPRDVELGVLEPVPVGESVGNTSFGKHATHKVPSIRRDLYPVIKRKPCLTAGTDTTAFPSTQTIAI